MHYNAFTTEVLNKDPNARPQTTIAAPYEAAIGWYSFETVFGVNIKAIFPTYPFVRENKIMKLIYHQSDANIT